MKRATLRPALFQKCYLTQSYLRWTRNISPHQVPPTLDVVSRFQRTYSTALDSETATRGPLKGVRILDLSRVLAGPLCTQILGDYGADIIKVEDIDRGDDTRYFRAQGEEFTWKEEYGPMSNYFTAVNRNKRSICLDFKQQKGREICLRLVEESDVVIDNFRPGALKRLGLDYESLRLVNPKIIQASVSGYGPTGPYAQRAGYDMIAGAEAGFLHLIGERNGPPIRPGLGVTDMCTGLMMHGAIIAALYSCKETGRGQQIDASLFETQISLLTNVAMTWLNLGQEAERWGAQHPSVVPYDAFKTKDLYFVCGAVNDKQFRILCEKLGVSELIEDPRFKTNSLRVENREALFPTLHEAFAAKTTSAWSEAFEGSGMPYAPINTMKEVFSHPQTAAREMVQDIEITAATSGRRNILGPAVKFSDTKATIRLQPPVLGEHTESILKEIGLSPEEVRQLREEKVVGGVLVD